MSIVFEPNHCQQCRHDSAHFEYDSRAGSYKLDCRHCGYHECHDPAFDEEANYSGYTHTVTKGAGVLWYRCSDERPRPIFCHYLHNAREVLAAERWLRERLQVGAVEAETACLTRWCEETQHVEVVVGQVFDILAGKIVWMSGVPGDVEQDIEAIEPSSVPTDYTG